MGGDMERTPERRPRPDGVSFHVQNEQRLGLRRSPRIKKNPSVTPKRFTKFFTPRLRNAPRGGADVVRTSRKALQALSAATLNSRSEIPISQASSVNGDQNRPLKRRRLSFSSVVSIPSSPIRSGPAHAIQEDTHDATDSARIPVDIQDDREHAHDDSDTEDFGDESPRGALPRQVVPYHTLSTSMGLFSRRLGGRKPVREAPDSSVWQCETTSFYSGPTDVARYVAPGEHHAALPFSVAAFHTRDRVAVGDEDGHIRYHDTVNHPSVDFSKAHVEQQPHRNAIMDLVLSSDDEVLVTASGDQSCHVIDTEYGRGRYTLVGHSASVKRVQFQPGSCNNVLVTCARDGSIILWDLRTASDKPPPARWQIHNTQPDPDDGWTCEIEPSSRIFDAHTSYDRFKYQRSSSKPAHATTRRNPIPSRFECTVTACSFLSASRPHLLATASENDAIIKLWDMRSSYSRLSKSTPVAATMEPAFHQATRQFGITSICMSSDGSRLYSLCRDHTIYAYSTSHLVVGGDPSLNLSSKPFKPNRRAGQNTGLGPLYGFRHPSLRLASFYSKLAIRTPGAEQATELLAAGSGEECAVLFPTNEKYLTASTQNVTHPPLDLSSAARPRSTRLLPSMPQGTSNMSVSMTAESDLPIYNHGTALAHGHRREVTAVAWTRNGNLLTTSDDCLARVWREEEDGAARALRTGKGRDHTWHSSGWAEVVEGWDEEDC